MLCSEFARMCAGFWIFVFLRTENMFRDYAMDMYIQLFTKQLTTSVYSSFQSGVFIFALLLGLLT